MSSDRKIYKAHNNLLLIAMFSIIMLFAGLTSAYIVSKGSLGLKWDYISMPTMFYLSTVMIIFSSMCGYKSVLYAKNDNFKMVNKFLSCTILFGLAFLLFQILGWKSLVSSGKFLSGNNVASSYFYLLTFAHLAHLFGGLVSLLYTFNKSFKKRYSSVDHQGLKLSIRFWHFLAFLWIYLFVFLIIIN